MPTQGIGFLLLPLVIVVSSRDSYMANVTLDYPPRVGKEDIDNDRIFKKLFKYK